MLEIPSLPPSLPSSFADNQVAKFLFHEAAGIFWKIENGEVHGCILDSDSLVDFAWKPHKSYFKLPPEPITHFIS